MRTLTVALLVGGWVVVAPTRSEATQVADALGGDVQTDFTGNGPPVSYRYAEVGLCPANAPSTS
jgi:hypothetical protein